MVSTNTFCAGMSRRSFFKTAGVAAAATGVLGSGLSLADSFLVPKQAHANSVEQSRFTYHPANCGNRCSLKCTVRDDKLALIQPNEWENERYNFACLKGMSEVQRVYSPDRIQTPLKRVGPRGSDEFVSITWDEALDTIAAAITESNNTYGKGSVLIPYSSGISYTMPIFSKLIGAQRVCESGIDMAIGNGLEATTGDDTIGRTMQETTDWVNSSTIFFVGNNLLETSLTDAQEFYNAKEAGAKIIVIDPVHTVTASKADLWVPINPGSDPALYLAMISEILNNNWYDKSFLLANTSAPFLVNRNTGAMARANGPSKDAKETGESNPFMVWDAAAGRAQAYNAGANPALEGTFEVDGQPVSTVFTLLKENQKDYTVKWAENLTAIPAATITELARTYSQDGPASLAMGFGGIEKFPTADIAGHAVSVLGALTGNFGKPGGGVGIYINHSACYSSAAKLGAWKMPDEFKETKLVMQTPLMRNTPNSVRVVYNMGNAIFQHLGNSNLTREWLDTLDLVVTADPFFSDSARYSDIVLPACTNFESEDEYGQITQTKNHVLLQQKVIDPLFESKTDFQIDYELCERLGLAEYHPKTTKAYNEALLNSTSPLLAGITLDTLVEHGGTQQLNLPDDKPYNGHKSQVYKTPSTKLDLYHEALVVDSQALPTYEDPFEVYAGSPLMQKYPLQFLQVRRRHRVHSQFFNATWINQIFEGSVVEIGTEEAASRGIKTGDTVKIVNDRGTLKVSCRVNPSIREGQVLFCEGPWMRDTNENCYQDLINDELIARGARLKNGANIPFNDTLVQVQKA